MNMEKLKLDPSKFYAEYAKKADRRTRSTNIHCSDPAGSDLAKRLKRSEDARQSLVNAIDCLQRRERALEQWIEAEGERTDTCTYNILKKVCTGCRCHRQNDELKHAEGNGDKL